MSFLDRAAELFESDPDWVEFAGKNGMAAAAPVTPGDATSQGPVVLTIPADRAAQEESETAWTADHGLGQVGYTTKTGRVQVRDGAEVGVKISWPKTAKEKLPVVFVTHGGGWVQGTHTTEEAWLLWPLYELDLVVVSVEYRLAPEHPFPTWMDDSWDVLDRLIQNPEGFVETVSGNVDDIHVEPDLSKLILAGSSAGAGIAAYLSQRCRDASIRVFGVILNVPLVCDYRQHPAELKNLPVTSYDQCTTSLLSSGEMRAVWELTVPASSTSDIQASPLLGDLDGLPPHLIFVAGQDPLRDEGLLYAQRLRDAGVSVELSKYGGVPHTFAEFWDLAATRRFWRDIRRGVAGWLA
jgi:acetyl esterase/lipase